MKPAETCPVGKPLACTVETAALQPSWQNCPGKSFCTDGKEGAKNPKNTKKCAPTTHKKTVFMLRVRCINGTNYASGKGLNFY